ncbi:MAG: diaminopimelate decarboxylase [Proteobacteria bacterium]|nr:diaminopimelate decarboxylase [Pseudomonadota bacterium]
MADSYLPPLISGELGQGTLKAAADRNFYARGTHPAALTSIDDVPISQLLQQFGSPLFVFSERDLRAKAHRMRKAFKTRYAKTSFAWSVKTNYLNAIIQVFRSEGWIAEVVSDFEYEKVRRLGIPGKDIVFNGPYKPRAALQRAVDEGALIQIDNWDELSHIEEIVAHARQPLEVGLRVWLDAGIRPVWSKFGFALANGEAERAAARIIGNPKLKLHTLHCHIGTYILAPEAYGITARKLVALREQLHSRYGHLVECLNLGGGFPSHSLLHGMAGPAETAVRPVEDYADAITDVLNDLPARKRPLLRLESGRCLVDEAGYLLTTVVAVKGIGRSVVSEADLSARDYKERLILGEDSKVGYVLDAGINVLYTAAWYQFDVRPARLINAPITPSRLYGPLCMNIDVIRENVDLPPLTTGDVISLHPVGAYNFDQSMQFIAYRPAVVLVGLDGKPEVIRARETLDDVQGPERIPAALAGTR